MSLQGRKVFITGGAGFIGSRIVEDMVAKGARVTIYDDFSSGLMSNLAAVAKDVKIVRGNIMDFSSLKRAMRGAEIVTHQAAHLEITKCILDPIDDLTVNAVGTLNVLKAAAAHKVGKLIYASSACVYGQAEYVPEDEERHPTNPNWAYGAAKLAGEKYCRIYSELHDMQTVGLRYAIIYGPREWYGRVLTIFLKRALAGKAPVVFGKGNQLRDFTFVDDLVDLHGRCLAQNTGEHEIFNVSTGIGTSIRKLAQTVIKVTGMRGKPVFEEVKEGERSALVEEKRERLPCELQRMVLDPAKAKRKLRWTPKVMLEEGLRREFEWLQEHPRTWKKMSY